MPGALTGSAVRHRHVVPAQPDPVTGACDRLLDAVVVLLATWTLAYHLCFVLRLDSTVAILLSAAALGAAATVRVVRRRRLEQASSPDRESDSDPANDPDSAGDPGHLPAGDPGAGSTTTVTRSGAWLLGTILAAGAVAALSMALRLPWVLVWVPWLLAAGAGTVLTLRALSGAQAVGSHSRPGVVDRPQPPGRRQAAMVLAVALMTAALSLVVMRPNPDDLFYVNLSQWVAVHGSFPHRDTLYADLVYPLSNWPPLASYDAGVGALAHLLGVTGATVAYVVVPPVASVLSVLALWRLLRAWQVRHVLVALTAAIVFMMFDGTSSYGPPGNLWVTRLWQGKVILLVVLVPWLLVAGLDYVRSPSRRRAGWLATGGVAAVACSTTALFLVPLVALAAAAPLVHRQPQKAAVAFGAMSAYPLAMIVLTKAVGGRSPDDFGDRRQFRFDPSWIGHEVFLDGVVAAIGVGAVLVGCLVVPHPAARVTTAVAALLTAMIFIPGVTHLSYALVGLGPTLWRLTWALSVAALVGAVASYVTHRLSRPLALVAAVVVTALLASFGHPILAADTTTRFTAPFHWQRSADTRRATTWIVAHTRPGDVVLGPDGLSITVAVTTTSIKTVTPRDYYLTYLRDDPAFDYPQRLALTEFANHRAGWQPEQVAPALQTLDVRVACVYRLDSAGAELLRQAGYRPALRTNDYLCLVPRAAGE